jgi:non-canonical poly(A) RNA polymerase PAPD5/7
MKLQSLINTVYPTAKLFVFGSCSTNLSLPSSDIDLLVYNKDTKEEIMINKLTNLFLHSGICQSIEPITKAKVPLIKMQDKESMIKLNISFNRTNGVYWTKSVKQI